MRYLTTALTGPPPTNMEFRNDAIGGSESNALLGRAGVAATVLLNKTLLLVACVTRLGQRRKLFEQFRFECGEVEARLTLHACLEFR